MPQLGDGPLDSSYEQQMNALGRLIDEFFNPDGEKKTGFVLMVFPFGDVIGHRINYLSNADRDDIVATMKHQIARFEGMPDQTGRA